MDKWLLQNIFNNALFASCEIYGLAAFLRQVLTMILQNLSHTQMRIIFILGINF
ncbi:hypothetical protein N879_13385 [Alcaligenes sp. EGD-AK7]|nr:hypothetical protein N879_13385 [Alcaligenes sp. EGD-AK7]